MTVMVIMLMFMMLTMMVMVMMMSDRMQRRIRLKICVHIDDAKNGNDDNDVIGRREVPVKTLVDNGKSAGGTWYKLFYDNAEAGTFKLFAKYDSPPPTAS